MDIAARPVGGEKLYLWLVIALGIGLSIFVGFLMGSDALPTTIMLLGLVLGIVWLAVARQRWWLLMPAGGLVGGYFWFGFKLYPHEVALLGCFAPLLIARAISGSRMVQRDRPPFPFAMYLLSGYLIAHWVGSNIYNRMQGEGGLGNVSRAYFNALWVILFLIAFRRFGSTKYIPGALLLCYLAAFARVAAAILINLTHIFAYIPVFNYVLPGSTHSGIIDLRTSGLNLGILAICYFLIHRGFMRRVFHGSVYLGSVVAVLFGAGRGALVLVCLVPLFAALIYRRMAPFLLVALATGTAILALNLRPAFLEDLPFAIRRSASIFLVNKSEAAHYGQALGSSEWHARLRRIGYNNWTQSIGTFIFGTGIRPYDYALRDTIGGITTTDDYLESAAKVGAYESGWWTVIAVTGLVGILAYLYVMFYLLKRLLPILLRERLRDRAHAFAFIAVFGIANWLALGWGNGGFPSTEIMFGFVALYALDAKKPSSPRSSAPVPEKQQLVASAALMRG